MSQDDAKAAVREALSILFAAIGVGARERARVEIAVDGVGVEVCVKGTLTGFDARAHAWDGAESTSFRSGSQPTLHAALEALAREVE